MIEKTKGLRRTVATITSADRSGVGAPVLYAYGRRWLALMAGCSARTVGRADKHTGLGDPVTAVSWLLERRGEHELAARVRLALAEEAE